MTAAERARKVVDLSPTGEGMIFLFEKDIAAAIEAAEDAALERAARMVETLQMRGGKAGATRDCVLAVASAVRALKHKPPQDEPPAGPSVKSEQLPKKEG